MERGGEGRGENRLCFVPPRNCALMINSPINGTRVTHHSNVFELHETPRHQ